MIELDLDQAAVREMMDSSAHGPTGSDESEGVGDQGATPLFPDADPSRALKFANKILAIGVDGLGPYKSATQIADEALTTHGDTEAAIKRLIAIHRRWVGSSGFATGMGGLATLPVAVTTDVTVFYMLCARMSAAIALLRGYDVQSEEVRSAVLISLLGANASAVVGRVGVEVGKKTTLAGLRRLPGRVLININRKVGYRLLTKFGTKGSINLIKGIPLVGGGVGASVNVVAINQIARYAKATFIPVDGVGH
ncbi:EcsC family protein [Mycolicibacter sinensis]|uniref:EcsC family protein n=1 Tax=Mycolicibacter sinensis (strain JDM601) TaxID=875328 RepID=UPI001F1EE428|nr:EcsC family protein [Mycolicibacter sinensis]